MYFRYSIARSSFFDWYFYIGYEFGEIDIDLKIFINKFFKLFAGEFNVRVSY